MKRIRPFLPFVLSVLMGLGATGCGATQRSPLEPPRHDESQSSPSLNRSLFSRDLTGSVGEEDLLKILDSRLDLDFPARVGVVTLGEPFRAEAAATLNHQAIINPIMMSALDGSNHFSHVTDVSTGLPNPHGVEGLRTIAARYRVRYLLVCNVVSEDVSHLNNWAWLYPTVIGFFALPGMTVGSEGRVEASLLDVKTGTVLFSSMHPFSTSSTSWVIGSSRHHAKEDSEALAKATESLARSVLTQTERVAAWSRQEQRLAAKP